MKKTLYIFLMILIGSSLFAGNPDRQGEAGAAELLLNPWARSAGLHSMTTASCFGVDALRLNPAGIGRVTGREVVLGNTRLFEGSDIQLNSLGFAQRAGKNSAFGISLMLVDFGDIDVTTTAQPEGDGTQYSPGFFNLGIGYSYTYENKISVGVLARAISESLPNVNAFGFAIDAGVQYVSGPQDNFRLGISLRNIGTPMRFSGEGLALPLERTDTESEFVTKFNVRANQFELPSVLNIGASYDFYFTGEESARQMYLRVLGNFTSNAFSRDQIGGGVEFQYGNLLTLRGGYKYELDSNAGDVQNIYTGFSAGASVVLPFQKGSKNRLGLDYAYRTTSPFRGTHNFSIRISF